MYADRVGSRASLLLWLGMTGCSKLLDIQDVSGPADARRNPGDTIGPPVDQAQLPVCTAQRVVELIGGNGGLAWFTLVWPMPDVVTAYAPQFAIDSPASYANASPDPSHPLFARLYVGNLPLWSGVGATPQPTAFVAGANETHTSAPTSVVAMLGNDLPAYAATLQDGLAPPVPALSFAGGGPFGTGETPVTAATANGAPAALEAAGVPSSVAEALAPNSAQLARYNTANANANERELGAELAFAANAFAAGVVGVVQMDAYRDDPHGAFDSGIATVAAHANETAMSLDAFYRDLAAANETSCGTGHGPLSLADNVVMMVLGDTPKDSYTTSGWPDGTGGNANYFYLRSNGFTKPGWFGQIDAQKSRKTFDPTTGALGGGDATSDTAAAQAAALYAIARGNAAAVGAITTAPYGGVVAQ